MDTRVSSDSEPPQRGLVPGLYWGVRESFVGYVRANPDGQIYGDDGVETDGQGVFRFPLERCTRDDAGWRLDFAGELRFIAHFGALDIALTRPRLNLADCTLRIETDRGHLLIARIGSAGPVAVDEWLVWPPLSATLTAEGADLFGGAYGEGAALDPLRIAIPLAETDEIQEKMVR